MLPLLARPPKLPISNDKIAKRQPAKTRFCCSSFFLSFFSQASALTPEATSTNRQEFFWDTAPAISILAKLNFLCSFSRHSKVQVPHWTPFCYAVMNKHKPYAYYRCSVPQILSHITIPTKKDTNK